MENRDRQGKQQRQVRKFRGTPTYKCDNCKCMRFNPCGCQKSAAKQKKADEV